LFGSGDLASARLFYERAANAGNGQAALRLGETYDPRFLDQARLRGARGDAAAAVFWYKRAHDLGMSEAEILLGTLSSQ
jgi:TPR repeat protein